MSQFFEILIFSQDISPEQNKLKEIWDKVL